MNKKKVLIISIIAVILIIVVVSAGTYAYLVATSNEGNIPSAGTGRLNIDYTSPENIGGSLEPSLTREDGLKAVSTVSLAQNSIKALFNMYINPTALTNLNIEALKWEVEGIKNGESVYTNAGNFSTAEVGKAIKIVDGYALDYESTTFNVYIWLDERLLTSGIDNASFGAKITADSSSVTGDI